MGSVYSLIHTWNHLKPKDKCVGLYEPLVILSLHDRTQPYPTLRCCELDGILGSFVWIEFQNKDTVSEPNMTPFPKLNGYQCIPVLDLYSRMNARATF